jgi:hypothetical protein
VRQVSATTTHRTTINNLRVFEFRVPSAVLISISASTLLADLKPSHPYQFLGKIDSCYLAGRVLTEGRRVMEPLRRQTAQFVRSYQAVRRQTYYFYN